MNSQKTGARRIVLFVEGPSEHALAAFFHNWLDAQLPELQRVGIKPVAFPGVSEYLKSFPKKLENLLDTRGANFVFGLLDLYGLRPEHVDLSHCATVDHKVAEARKVIHQKVPPRLKDRFCQHFAVHELEAWLLAYPERWPADVRQQIETRSPEAVNFEEPPANFLRRILGRRYKKTVCARNIFPNVDPRVAIGKCPYLRRLAEDMLEVARRLQ